MERGGVVVERGGKGRETPGGGVPPLFHAVGETRKIPDTLPAFDVTPITLVTGGIVTDIGIFRRQDCGYPSQRLREAVVKKLDGEKGVRRRMMEEVAGAAKRTTTTNGGLGDVMPRKEVLNPRKKTGGLAGVVLTQEGTGRTSMSSESTGASRTVDEACSC